MLLLTSLTAKVSATSVLVMGDSLSAAYQLPIEQGWVALLNRELQSKYDDVIIVNASISGETTQGGRSRFAKLLTDNAPDLVILELGANDALRGYPLSKTKDNLAFMIESSQKQNANILLLGNRLPPNYGRRYSEAFFNLYQELADQYSINLIPFMLENVALDDTLMQDDGYHPNAQGQLKLLDNIMPEVLILLEKNKESI